MRKELTMNPFYYISAERIICEGQDLTIQTLSSVMVTFSCNLVFRFLPFDATFQTKISDTS